MKRKAIECVAPKKPAGKGLTATLQELEKRRYPECTEQGLARLGMENI